MNGFSCECGKSSERRAAALRPETPDPIIAIFGGCGCQFEICIFRFTRTDMLTNLCNLLKPAGIKMTGCRGHSSKLLRYPSGLYVRTIGHKIGATMESESFIDNTFHESNVKTLTNRYHFHRKAVAHVLLTAWLMSVAEIVEVEGTPPSPKVAPFNSTTGSAQLPAIRPVAFRSSC